MGLFSFPETDSIGRVISVDTATLIVKVDDLDKLRRLQVNHLVCLRSSKAGQHLIGLITRITRKLLEEIKHDEHESDQGSNVENIIKISLIGSMLDKYGTKTNVFRRTIESVPEIDSLCFVIEGAHLALFMKAIAQRDDKSKIKNLSLGKYTIDEEAEAFLDGNKLFQRHTVVVGSTGSGKSWCVAKLLEEACELKNANAILFDLHGEYKPLKSEGIVHYKIAGPIERNIEESLDKKILFLPYWLLTYDEIIAMLLDRSDQNAPNQAMIFSRSIYSEKKKHLDKIKKVEISNNFTIDSPVPYDIEKVIENLKELDEEMVEGAKPGTEKQGPFHGKLSRFVQRLEAKCEDKRLTFLFGGNAKDINYDWFNKLCSELMLGKNSNAGKGIKIIDFSEVPSDILPLIIGLVARIIFSIQQWCPKEKRQPIALLCDEAHLYIPERFSDNSLLEIGYRSFERIAKEGRKYGVGLVVISQRPSEVNKTVMSQCNNFISMKLTNADDQNVVKKLLPDNLGGVTDILAILDIGEALIVGDASLLPTRIRVSIPKDKPQSATVDFWDEWAKDKAENGISEAVEYLRKQSKTSTK